jgi:hypothetical protein
MKFGKPDKTVRDKVPKLGIEKTTTLATIGAYGYIRYFFCSSLLFVGWGYLFQASLMVGSDPGSGRDTGFGGCRKDRRKRKQGLFRPCLGGILEGDKNVNSLLFEKVDQY